MPPARVNEPCQHPPSLVSEYKMPASLASDVISSQRQETPRAAWHEA
ncbi:MAG: hypothetical protein QOH12_3381 [Solirubrobacteraceae bacterium]|jgi:hypothetical protein|nr:hypothetical protein [Solirubrobacteraceae bacterium]